MRLYFLVDFFTDIPAIFSSQKDYHNYQREIKALSGLVAHA